MNEQIKDGGPVFPCRIPTGAIHKNEDPEPTTMHHGMTLRDHFAAKAMQGLIGRSWADPTTGKTPPDIFNIWAVSAYGAADEMLKERVK